MTCRYCYKLVHKKRLGSVRRDVYRNFSDLLSTQITHRNQHIERLIRRVSHRHREPCSVSVIGKELRRWLSRHNLFG